MTDPHAWPPETRTAMTAEARHVALRDAPVDVYLDVDGVINAVCLSDPRDWGWPEGCTVRANGFSIRYAPELVARLNALAALPHVTMHWLTTWEDDAPKHLAPAVGLNGGEWDVLGTDEHYSRTLAYSWWKHAALVDYFPERGCRAVWIDDDINFDEPARTWARGFADRLLLVSPETRRGLTRSDMETIERFVGSHDA